MLQCVRCHCLSDDEEGWLALVPDPEDATDANGTSYCPPCAGREVRRVGDAAGYD